MTEGELSEQLDAAPAPRRLPQVGDPARLHGQPGRILDVAQYPAGVCQVVIQLDSPPGRPPVSVPLEDLDAPLG